VQQLQHVSAKELFGHYLNSCLGVAVEGFGTKTCSLVDEKATVRDRNEMWRLTGAGCRRI
jgi:hypothetical protein